MDPRTQRYVDAFAAVRQVLNEVDPENLIAGGAPEDEYDQEAGVLVRLVMRAQVTRERVGAVWQGQFALTDDDLEGKWLTVLTERLCELESRYGTSG
jgi:hypothetical protein